MLNKTKQLNLLGLATRANKLISGEDAVVLAIRKQEAALVVLASDCSPATRKKLMDKCSYYQVPAIEFATTLDISSAIGKKRSIVAFSDKGFAKSFLKHQEREA